MKKLITILFAVVLTFSLSAQQFGIKAGLNIASISADDGPEDSRMGMHLGALVMFELSDAVDLRTGLIYSQKGAVEEDVTLVFPGPYYYYYSNEDDMIFALDYLEIPVDFTFKVSDNGFALSAGPYLAFLLSDKIKFDGEEEDVDDFFELMGNDAEDGVIKGMDVGINIGASFLVNESILIDARYSIGLMDITDIEEMDYYTNKWSDASSDKNACFSISIGYVFGG